MKLLPLKSKDYFSSICIAKDNKPCVDNSVNADEEGKQALMQLANGDMRRVLNLLQSAHMSHGHITEENVYLTAGAAVPAVIHSLLVALLNESFADACATLQKVSVHVKPLTELCFNISLCFAGD